MALNDAVPSSATDVFKRNAEDADRLLNATGNITTRTGKILPSWDEITQSHAAWNNRGAWTTTTAYAVNDIWEDGGVWYVVLSAYTSGASAAADIAGPNIAVLNGNFGSAATKDAGTDFDQIPLNADIVYPVATVADLRNLEPTVDGQQFNLLEYNAGTGLGGGTLYYDASDTTSTDDGGSVFVTATGKRIKRELNAASVDTSMWGGGEFGFIGAINYLQSNNGGVINVSDIGTVELSDELNISSWTKDIRITSAGKDITEVKINTSDKSILTGAAGSPLSLQIDNITFCGYWRDVSQQSTVDCWLINATNITTYYQTSARFISSQKGLVKVVASNKAESTFCEGAEASRGGFNFTGSSRINALSNDFKHLGDDAISAHTPSGAASIVGSQHHIVGNTMRDCQGIAALGARNTIISGNTGKLIRTRFLFIGYDEAFGEGFNTSGSVVVSDNTVEDCLNKGAFDGGASNVGYYMQIEGYPASDGGTLNSSPGTNYAAGPSITPLYGNMNAVGDRASTVIAGMWNIAIKDNIIVRTEDDGVAYTSYGQVDEFTPTGQYFTEAGYQDSVIDSSEFALAGIELAGNINNFCITGGIIQTGYRSIRFSFDADDPRFTGGYVGGGIQLKDATNDIVSTNASSANYPNILDVTFNDVVFDADPFFRSSLRSSLDGTWSASSSCRAFNIPYCVGVRLGNITVKNCSKLSNSSGGGTSTVVSYIGKITYQCEPTSTGDSAANKGVRDIGAPSDVVQHELYDCDPTSSTYSQLTRGAISYSSTSIPTSGTYIAGEFVRKTNRSVDGNNMVLIGWQRLTTGAAHVLNTDWVEQYTSSVSPST